MINFYDVLIPRPLRYCMAKGRKTVHNGSLSPLSYEVGRGFRGGDRMKTLSETHDNYMR